MELSTAAQRISHYIATVGVSENEFTRRTQWSQGLLGKAVKRGSAIGSDKIEQVLRQFPDLNPRWVISGDGPMTLNPGQPTPKQTTADYGNIIVLESKATAGLLSHHGQQEFLNKQPRMSLPGPQFRGAGLLAIQVEGDSMEPTIMNGDWLVVRQLQHPQEEVRQGQVYVIVTREGALAKRLYLDLTGQSIDCRSDNPSHRSLHIKDREALVYDVLALLRENLGDQRQSITVRLTQIEAELKALKERGPKR